MTAAAFTDLPVTVRWLTDRSFGDNEVEAAFGLQMDVHMNREDVIARLRDYEPELKASGIASLSLFGSVARGETGNDVDLVAEFEESRKPSLIQLVGLENRLSDLLGCKVDLSQKASLKPRVRANVEREAILAF